MAVPCGKGTGAGWDGGCHPLPASVEHGKALPWGGGGGGRRAPRTPRAPLKAERRAGQKGGHPSSAEGQQMGWKERNLVEMRAVVPAAGIMGQLFSV